MSSTESLPKYRELGLTDAEYQEITRLHGRAPNDLELAMFSLMWSEHCGYKHSKKLLKLLPNESADLVMGPGENAGVVRLPGGLAAAFKVESHNHPSAVEPFQGAATGVGGILRDIFAVGARPVAMLDSLRFGEQTSSRSRYLLDHAVAGIGHYGNSIGVPTVAGEVYFEHPYESNCLVNAMCVGFAKETDLIRSAASGVGNLLVLFGALTGRDGIGGASVLASAELSDEDQDKRPTVQIGDPFVGKKLMECSLELVERDLLVSLQDLGAAGLTSSSSEMASKGEVGLDINLDWVPLREADMQPFEIMVSESQERMLAIVTPEQLTAVQAVCAKWELPANVIGTVTDSRRLRIFRAGKQVGDMSVSALVDDCPLYDLKPAKITEQVYPAPVAVLDQDRSLQEKLLALLGSSNICSRRSVYQRYDSIVQSRTVKRPGSADAAVLKLPGGEAVALALDCNGRRVACDPYWGTVAAVLECAANLACVGAAPLGLTNCLNFGNPEKPHVAWQLERAVSAIAEVCNGLEIPVVGGNVSLYNESPDGPIYPTPVIGMLGLVDDVKRSTGNEFRRPGDVVALIGDFKPSLAGSELSKLFGEELPKELEPIDINQTVKVQRELIAAVAGGLISSAHDVTEGGLLVAIAECVLAGESGVELDLAQTDNSYCFGECSGGFIISASEDQLQILEQKVSVARLGRVTETGGMTITHGADTVKITRSELNQAYNNKI